MNNKFYFSKVNDPDVWESEQFLVLAKNGNKHAAEMLLTQFNLMKQALTLLLSETDDGVDYSQSGTDTPGQSLTRKCI